MELLIFIDKIAGFEYVKWVVEYFSWFPILMKIQMIVQQDVNTP